MLYPCCVVLPFPAVKSIVCSVAGICLARAQWRRGHLLGVAALSKLEFVCYALRASFVSAAPVGFGRSPLDATCCAVPGGIARPPRRVGCPTRDSIQGSGFVHQNNPLFWYDFLGCPCAPVCPSGPVVLSTRPGSVAGVSIPVSKIGVVDVRWCAVCGHPYCAKAKK